jgi:arylsulfatase
VLNLRTDPFERADHEAIGYGQWRAERMFMLAPAQMFVGKYLQSFKDFPPRQKPGSFNLSNAMDKITSGSPNN